MNITRMHEYLPRSAHPRVWAAIDKSALIHNWRTLAGRVCAASPATRPYAVIKADAYGHGIRPAAEALAEAGCRRFAVACLEEAVALRRVLRAEIRGRRFYLRMTGNFWNCVTELWTFWRT